jgi:hypothetical protein
MHKINDKVCGASPLLKTKILDLDTPANAGMNDSNNIIVAASRVNGHLIMLLIVSYLHKTNFPICNLS